jgi:hypothetical protein
METLTKKFITAIYKQNRRNDPFGLVKKWALLIKSVPEIGLILSLRQGLRSVKTMIGLGLALSFMFCIMFIGLRRLVIGGRLGV